eukprot:CAMPEP_0174885664 /NCGR_PEP_ID=MMETSP0167-20121228/933_1 /TAXON_ID=38298 /ORGANISM="Rhodella maculata, Strain CCMP736" /LENGTH=255 /DNA_ID=CAMNT_0016121325 /DNA_START=140 /DNA_END=907 /DNA_ORIENTATION=+
MRIKRKTAACIIIGNEILSGKVHDSNSHYLAQLLFNRGIQLQRVEVIPDVEGTIIESVSSASRLHDFVFTSGGIGCTHDDITYDSIAKAFGLTVKEHAETIAKMKEIQPLLDIDGARRRMALLPHPCRALWTPELWVPLAVVNGNVFILPGVPKLFRMMLEANLDAFDAGEGVSQTTRRFVWTKQGEGDYADALRSVAEREVEEIEIGSYPKWMAETQERWCQITVEGDDEEKVKLVTEEVVGLVSGKIGDENGP